VQWINKDNMEEWSLIRKITGLDLTKKCFDTDDLPQSDKHEEQIERFTTQLENEGHEIFKVEGHQFITSDGVYTIAHEEEIEYGE
tara:strand:+ start:1437 stop:1691 length:255 start_codon:yes stop_codon:yes gene_type:complete